VVLVEHAGNPITARIIESRVMANPGQVPIAFELPYTTAEIDPEALYTVSAAIVDGTRLWATDGGTRVITYGNPVEVDLNLVLRSDLLKGQVTGAINGDDVTLAGTGFAAAVLFDSTTNQAVGMTVVPAPTGVPIDFSVPFDPADINEAAEYVVVAGIIEGDNRWANREGVPVITQGNPLTDVTVPVSAVTPAPDEDGGGLLTIGALVLLLILGVILGIAIWFIRRSRASGPPDDAGGPGEAAPVEEPAPGDDSAAVDAAPAEPTEELPAAEEVPEEPPAEEPPAAEPGAEPDAGGDEPPRPVA
jgi:uncharacterized lipoprotein YbaY